MQDTIIPPAELVDNSQNTRADGQDDFTREARTFEDYLFLTLVVILSSILYLKGLGFHSTDWAFLGKLHAATDHSFMTQVREINFERVHMRPLEVFSWVVLHKLFGVHPLGYHLLNAVVFLLGTLLFYSVLQLLNRRRILCLAAVTIYSLLPHYATNRFWIHGLLANFSLLFYFMSLHADLRALHAPSAKLWCWKVLSLLSMIMSVMSYEVTLPLFFLNPMLVVHRYRLFFRKKYGKRYKPDLPDNATFLQRASANLKVLYLITGLAALPLVLFKFFSTTYVPSTNVTWDYFAGITAKLFALHFEPDDWGLNIIHAIAVHWGEYVLGMPYIVWQILQRYFDPVILAAALLLGIIVFAHFHRASGQTVSGYPNNANLATFITWGWVVFGAGYAIFLTNYCVQFSATGVANRTAYAAAIGVALVLTGVLGKAGRLYPTERDARIAFAAFVAVFCVMSLLITNTVARFWIAASSQQQEILADLGQQLGKVSPGSTLLLDGICPYFGPAVVFEAGWELSAAVTATYGQQNMQIDLVTPQATARTDGLYIDLYGGYQYPYSNLFIYNFAQKKLFALNSFDDAQRYFQACKPQSDCPPSRYGIGVEIF